MKTDPATESVTWKWIPVDAIAAPLFNSRDVDNPTPETQIDGGEVVKLESIEALAASMKSEGQIQPIVVRLIVDDGDNSKYRLIAGSRRLAGAKFNKWERIKAEIKLSPPTAESDAEDVVSNAVENFGRKNLSTFETARTFAELRNRKISLETITEKTGFSGAYISKLAKSYSKLHDTIKEEWRKGNKNAHTEFLYELTKEKPADQLPMWEAHIAAADAEDDDDGDDDGASDGKKRTPREPVEVIRVPKARYTTVVRLMSKHKVPSAAVEIVKYLAGKTDVCTALKITKEEVTK